MFKDTEAFSGFAVPDVDAAKRFYGETLGLEVSDEEMGVLGIKLGSGQTVMVYPKDDHQPANYTMLNFAVDDIDAAVDALAAKGVDFERYDGFEQDEKGIARASQLDEPGPDIAWFTDPAGNILAVLAS
jgi:catechol 2,3-dioxygenase-like lactoylglutathione lyase family enzyme